MFFKSFSRYTLIASAGAAVLWPLGLSLIPNIKIRNIIFGVLIASASLTHYANGLARVHDQEMCIVAQLSGDENKRVQALLQAGASKCIFKRTTAEQMLGLIREVVRERR